jgi:nitrous oxidase accessory protein NosD
MGYLLVNGRVNGFTGNFANLNSSFGLLAYGIDDTFIANNLIERSGGVGVILDNSKRNAFMDNTSSFNSGIGAYFSPSTDGNYSTRNQYQGNAFSLGLIDEGSNFGN